MEDIGAAQPTLFIAVPRLYNRLYDKIQSTIETSGAVKKWLINTAMQSKLSNLRSNGTVTHFLWDRLVFAKIAAALGGRVRLMVTGSAPISSTVVEFLRVAFCSEVIEGYGMTEVSCSLFLLQGRNPKIFIGVVYLVHNRHFHHPVHRHEQYRECWHSTCL